VADIPYVDVRAPRPGAFRFDAPFAYPGFEFEVPIFPDTPNVPAVVEEVVEEVPVTARRIPPGTVSGVDAFQRLQDFQYADDLAGAGDYLRSLSDETLAQLDDVVRAFDQLAAQNAAREAAEAAARTAATAALPEVLVTAGRVLGGLPFGVATGVLEGALALGGYLSSQALELALGRIEEPAPPPPPVGLGDPLGPYGQPEVEVSAPRPPSAPPVGALWPDFSRFPVPGLDVPWVGAFPDVLDEPRPLPAPFPVVDTPLSGSPTQPFPLLPGAPIGAPFPGLLPGPGLSTSAPFPTPSLPPEASLEPGRNPNPFPSFLLTPFQPPVVGSPSKRRDCDCPPKKKRKKKQARVECYTGTYRETAKSLTKRPRRKIPCLPSKSK
jgi:hypothetical protein